MQIASLWIWTRINVSISYDGYHYTMNTYLEPYNSVQTNKLRLVWK